MPAFELSHDGPPVPPSPPGLYRLDSQAIKGQGIYLFDVMRFFPFFGAVFYCCVTFRAFYFVFFRFLKWSAVHKFTLGREQKLWEHVLGKRNFCASKTVFAPSFFQEKKVHAPSIFSSKKVSASSFFRSKKFLPLHLNWVESTLQIIEKGIMTMRNDE